MINALLNGLLIALLIVAILVGIALSFAGTYSARIAKGPTQAARTLDLLCWALAFVGVIIFTLASALLIPRVMM